MNEKTNMNYAQAATYSNYNHTGSDRYSLVNTGAVIEMIRENSNFDVWKYQSINNENS